MKPNKQDFIETDNLENGKTRDSLNEDDYIEALEKWGDNIERQNKELQKVLDQHIKNGRRLLLQNIKLKELLTAEQG